MYTLFVILHIISAGVWIGLGVVAMLANNYRRKAEGTLGELYLMRATLIFGAVMGNIGGIGILITGGAMTGITHLPWFAFNAIPWLAMKQTIFVILLIMTFAVMVPRSKRAGRMIGEQMGGATPQKGASPELRILMNTIYTIGLIMQILILTNIILGEWKPLLWLGSGGQSGI